MIKSMIVLEPAKMPPKYVIDSSSLIQIKPEKYPPDIYESQWNKIEELIKKKRLIAPQQVFEELKAWDDQLHEWAKKHKKMFKKLTTTQINKVREIINRFPELIDVDKEVDDADPYVIALAMIKKTLTDFSNESIVITEEKLKENKINIPRVCQEYNIKCMDVFDMFRNEGWKF